MAETKIGAIVAELKLNSSKFSRGLVKAEKGMKGFKSSVKRLGGSLIALAGIGGMGLFIKSTLDATDSIGKFADRAGITTTELQKMRFAFDLAGVGVEATDKALLTFGKRLGKARLGIGALEGGLKKGKEELLKNIKATNTINEALDVTFKAMGAAKNQAEKLAIADAAFGTAGLRMTAAFRDGSDAFFRAKKEAEDLGIVIDEDLIRNSEELNDQMTRVSKLMTTQLQAAFLGLAPAISGAAQELIDFIKELKEVNLLTEKVANDQSLGGAFGRVQEKIQKLQEILKANEESLFSGMFEELNEEIRAELKSLGIIRNAIIETVRGGGRISDKPKPKGGKSGIDSAVDFGDGNKKLLDEQVKDFEKHKAKILGIQLEILAGPNADAENQLNEFKEAVANLTLTKKEFDETGFFFKPQDEELAKQALISAKAIELGLIDVSQAQVKVTEESERMEEALAFFDASTDELESMKIKIEEVGLAMDFSAEEIRLALLKAEDHFGKGEEVVSDWEKQILQSVETIRSGLESGLTEAFQGAINGTETFKDTFLDILKLIQREIIRTVIVGQLLKAIGGAFGGFLGGGGGGGGVPTTLFDSFGDALAEGGPVQANKSFLVGEKGPEIFTPSGSGRIIPNDQMGNGGGDQIILQVTTGLQSTVKAELISMLPKIQKTLKAGVADARQRGGRFSQAMGGI